MCLYLKGPVQNMNRKNNQRFQDTELRLETAALKLMKHTSFKKITVKNICETAGVNRTTFYAHYIDIYDMLEKIEDRLHQELLNGYPNSGSPENTLFSVTSFIPFLQHIKKHQYFYKIALQTRTDFPLQAGYEQLWEQVIKPQCQKAGITSEDDMMYYFVYFQAGFTMVLKRWVTTDCTQSETEIAAIIKNCLPAVWL